MDVWKKIIVEWINCLEIQEKPVESVIELQDGMFYINFLKLIKWKKLEKFDQEDIIKFIEEEYSSFKVNKNDETEHIYISTLLLLHLCRTLSAIHQSLQYNMCDNMKNETQVRVKAFLESILPIGKDITKETMKEVIMEVEDIAVTTNNLRTPPLEDFSKSPMTRSTRSMKIMTDRIRELRDLKSRLAVERFTNADLRDDIIRQHNKIKKLQKKLDEKSSEMKELREEWMKPKTPQSSRTKESDSQVDYYKRYIMDLENQLSKQQDEINKLETEKDQVLKELDCTRRTSKHYKENYATSERSLESLSNKIELKDRELIELRMYNEELRAIIKELNKNINPEQSFEVEDVVCAASKSLNSSEALSSVIEIQLQEAKEESAVLQAQVDSLKGRLDLLTKDYKSAMELNRDLQEKVKTLDRVQAQLNDAQIELDISNTAIENLQEEKVSLVTQRENLKSLLSSKEKELSQVVELKTTLNTELNDLKSEMKKLNKSLKNEKDNSSNLNTALAESKSQATKYLTSIHELTDERDSYKSSYESCANSLRDILHCDNTFIQVHISKLDSLNNLTLEELIKYIERILKSCDVMRVSYEIDIKNLNAKIDTINTNFVEQQVIIKTLEERNKQAVLELSIIEDEKKQKDILLNKQKETIHTYLQEIEVLKVVRDEKLILEQNVHDLTNSLISRELLLNSVTTQLKNLQNINKNLKLIKEETQQSFGDYQQNLKLTFEKLQYEYHTLYHNYHEVQREKVKLEQSFNCNKEELLEIQAINTTLQQNLLENKSKIAVLEEKKKSLFDELNESKCNVQELKNEKSDLMRSHKETLETKDKEIKAKEEAMLTLQTKIDKLTNEANSTEKKMKEIIINLQEIRSTQDAVLTTQEAALKEKCLYIEKLQEEFETSKETMSKELEDVKSSLHECQAQFLSLENQRNDQNKTITELQGVLETMGTELETSKEYCKYMDASQAEIVKLCQELEHPTKNLNSTIMETCSNFNLHHDTSQSINIENKYKYINADSNANILNIIRITIDELYKSQKIISHLACTNGELNETLLRQKMLLLENGVKDKEEVCNLKIKVQELEVIAQKRNNYLKSLIKSKESFKDSLQKVFVTQNDLDATFTSSKKKWNEILTKFENIFYAEEFVCDEFKQLQIKKTSLENILLKCQIGYSEHIKSICDILWENFLWTEQKLHDTYLCSIHEKECLDVLASEEEDQFLNEKMIINRELEKYKTLQTNFTKSEEEIESFAALATFYDENLQSGKINSQVEVEKKLQNQINQLTKEKKELKIKMDNMRLRHVKLEKNIDDLRAEIKRLKLTEAAPVDANLAMSEKAQVQLMKEELELLKKQNQQLHEDKKSSEIIKQKLEDQLKEIHGSYEQKLEDIKQKMKTVYNEQMMKLGKDQENILQERLQNQMDMMCQKQREELNKYKAHVSELSSQLWTVGEKLLIEQQDKQDTLQRVKELEIKIKDIQDDQRIATISRKACTMEKQELLPENTAHKKQTHKVTTLVTEEKFERRHSIRSIQVMGNAFKTEDEEEVFDNVYLADVKKGNFVSNVDTNRLSVLQMRNSLCKPHMKSSYAAEMQFFPSTLTEEEIKTGSSVEENFNDSLSQSLLPEQKTRKKDKSQISYKKPGPPTPSKNGGRLSLQGNELRSPSSRVLKERNVDKKTTTTPISLKNIFSLKRQDENTTSTPKNRRLSNLFRKPRLQSNS
ncbi:hypothetical protein PUN28_010416 [Cardiocondyla obscurior]